ncbi:MAG: aldo/keto reductase [Phycisphaerales bacterium]
MPSALDHYVTLGHSGLRVSPLCLGAMTFGTDWGIGVEEPESVEILEAYLDKGGNFIDTANMYNKGHSEVILGNYFHDRHGVGQNGATFPERDRVVIATKWLGNLYPGDPNGGGASRKTMIESVDHSLRRLRTDYIDLLWQHFWDRHTPIEETMRALDDLVTSGKVRYVGFSDTPAWVCAQAQMLAHFRGWSPLIALQIEYSLAERTVEGELIPMAQHLGLGVTPWSPLKGGVLTGKYRKGQMPDEGRVGEDSNALSDKNFAIVDVLERVAGQAGCTIAQAALAWVRLRPGVDSTIIGARRMHHLEDNLKSLDVDLSDEHISALDEVSEPKLNFPHDFLNFVTDGIQNGTTVNGKPSNPWNASPQDHGERW